MRGEAEQALDGWGITYEKASDGTLVVHGNLDIDCRGLTELPDLTCVVVRGAFNCGSNRLRSLKGAPGVVLGGFYCAHNELTSLEGAPRSAAVFWCDHNQLRSLAGGPDSVEASFRCNGNQLHSLEGAPRRFKQLLSDFGIYPSWEDIPETLRLSPAECARLAAERKQAAAREATMLQKPLAVKKPFTFKR